MKSRSYPVSGIVFFIFIVIFIFILSMLSACRGALQVDRTRSFKSEKTNIGKIVCIDPDFELLITTSKRKAEHQFRRETAKEIQLNNILVRNAQKNNLTLELVDTERLLPGDMEYFSQLAPLKHEILQVSFLQDFLNKKKRRNRQKVFNRYENGPVIGSHFSYLADEYGTPYFAVQGITTHRKPNNGPLTYYYTIIAESYLSNGRRWTVDGRRTLWTMNYGLWTALLLCLAFVASGQTTGYQGKRLMFKTDVVSPVSERGINMGLEYVVLRNVVLGLDFSLTGKQYTQRLPTYYELYGKPPSSRASIRDMQIGITGQYFLNAALPAPKGSYIFGKYSIGQADILAVDHIVNGGQDDFLEGFEINNVSSQQFDLGVGYQEVFFGFLLVDLDLGMSAASLFLSKNSDELPPHRRDIVADFANEHGPNIFSLGTWRDTPGGIGLSIHLKIGILLF